MKSHVKRITGRHVQIDQEGKLTDIQNDAVIICAGGILPTDFLRKIGVTCETKYGTP